MNSTPDTIVLIALIICTALWTALGFAIGDEISDPLYTVARQVDAKSGEIKL